MGSKCMRSTPKEAGRGFPIGRTLLTRCRLLVSQEAALIRLIPRLHLARGRGVIGREGGLRMSAAAGHSNRDAACCRCAHGSGVTSQ